MINLVSYFEIGGQIVETGLHIEEAMSQQYLQLSDFSLIPRKEDVVIAGVATSVAKAVGKEDYSVARALRAPRRYTSARSALAVAATMAAADGPLPIGDVLAIGVLTGFALYQGYHGIRDIVQ